MAQNYKIRNVLKGLPFYSDKINKIIKKKRSKNLLMVEFYLNYHSFPLSTIKRGSILSKKIQKIKKTNKTSNTKKYTTIL